MWDKPLSHDRSPERFRPASRTAPLSRSRSDRMRVPPAIAEIRAAIDTIVSPTEARYLPRGEDARRIAASRRQTIQTLAERAGLTKHQCVLIDMQSAALGDPSGARRASAHLYLATTSLEVHPSLRKATRQEHLHAAHLTASETLRRNGPFATRGERVMCESVATTTHRQLSNDLLRRMAAARDRCKVDTPLRRVAELKMLIDEAVRLIARAPWTVVEHRGRNEPLLAEIVRSYRTAAEVDAERRSVHLAAASQYERRTAPAVKLELDLARARARHDESAAREHLRAAIAIDRRLRFRSKIADMESELFRFPALQAPAGSAADAVAGWRGSPVARVQPPEAQTGTGDPALEHWLTA